MWEGQALPHHTKFGNYRYKIVDSRAFLSWSLIHGLRWSGLIKAEPGVNGLHIGSLNTIKGTSIQLISLDLFWNLWSYCEPQLLSVVTVSTIGILILANNIETKFPSDLIILTSKIGQVLILCTYIINLSPAWGLASVTCKVFCSHISPRAVLCWFSLLSIQLSNTMAHWTFQHQPRGFGIAGKLSIRYPPAK